MTRATRESGSPDDAAPAGAAAIRSATAVAASTCCWIVGVLGLATAPPPECESEILACAGPESAAALCAGGEGRFDEADEGGTRADGGGLRFAAVLAWIFTIAERLW
jgi:hypothetical protein